MTDLEIREYPEHPRLGRKVAVLDPRSRAYAAIGTVADETPLRTKTWRRYIRAYDQGYTSQCTAYAGKGLVNTQPLTTILSSFRRMFLSTDMIYDYSQTIDEWPGEDYDGTSVLAAAKAFQHFEYIRGYRWCFGISDVLHTLSSYGPVGIGVTWYDSMFEPDERGNLTVDTRSGIAGGHAVQIQGINVSNETVTITNSWGTGWGDRGRCYMKWDDLDTLLRDWGEAVTYL